jgi:DNA-binding NarL/FixJ family response regulator
MSGSEINRPELPIRVWLVEDNERYRDTIGELLAETAWLEPTTFASCSAALESLDAGQVPHVALMDVTMPGMNGIEGTRLLSSQSPTTSIVMLTVHDSRDIVFDALCAGASGYLLKTASAEEIIDAISMAVRGEAPIDGSIARKVLDLFRGIAVPPVGYDLTHRETEILQLLVEGLTKRQISGQLFVSFSTIDSHVRNIYAKLHVNSRSGAVRRAIEERLI